MTDHVTNVVYVAKIQIWNREQHRADTHMSVISLNAGSDVMIQAYRLNLREEEQALA